MIKDPFYWFENWCYTQDVHRPELPKAKFPSVKEAPHLYRFIEALATERRILNLKARQLTWSWTSTAWMLWCSQFDRNQMNFFISQKQRKANNLIARAKFIYYHQPCPREVLDLNHTVIGGAGGDIGTRSIIRFYPPAVEFDKGASFVQSKLEAFSEEADDIRMDTASRVLVDEMAYILDIGKLMSAIDPALGQTGQLIGVSSPNGDNEFWHMCHDTTEEESI